MSITDTGFQEKLNKSDSVLEFVQIFKDILSKDGLDNIKNNTEELRSLIKDHQKILDDNNTVLAEHKKSYAAFLADKAAHESNILEFKNTTDKQNSVLQKREGDVRKREIASTSLTQQHEVISADLVKREDSVSKREIACLGRELDLKKAEKSNVELKAKLDARQALIAKPLE